MRKLVWLTDIHLNFLQNKTVDRFIGQVKEERPDVLLIGGDIGVASDVVSYLMQFERTIDSKIYFVLGNHDFYGGSLSKVKYEVSELCKTSDKLVFLDNVSYIELTKDTALVGNSLWADGRYGNYNSSDVMLNDYLHIKELTGLSKKERLNKLHELGTTAANQLKKSLETAFTKYNRVLCLTHVPPFRESCWHLGQISNDDYLPHFSCKAAGDVMKTIMEKKKNCSLTVLCGHTHSSGKVKVLDNLEVITGSAEYGKPKIQQMIYLGDHKTDEM